MNKRDITKAASAFGRLGGKVKSKRKAAAARLNGQKGGWPKGKPRKGKKGKRGVRVKIENAHLMYDALAKMERRTTAAFNDALSKAAAREFSGRPKGKKR